MKRVVEPEWLDELPAQDPRALASRRDLTHLNSLMGHAAIFHRLISSTPKPRRIAELGAGEGLFLPHFIKKFSGAWNGCEVILVDRKDAVSDEARNEFARLDCPLQIVTADAGDWLAQAGPPVDLILANLFLHHFSEGQLRHWFSLAARRTNIFAACEPRRSTASFYLSRMVGVIGCNDVTRHDAPVSVRAGFADGELSALWPAKKNWHLEERAAGFASHAFLARRTIAV